MTKQCPISRKPLRVSVRKPKNLLPLGQQWVWIQFDALIDVRKLRVFIFTQAVHLLILYYSIIYLSPVVRLLVIDSKSRIASGYWVRNGWLFCICQFAVHFKLLHTEVLSIQVQTRKLPQPLFKNTATWKSRSLNTAKCLTRKAR